MRVIYGGRVQGVGFRWTTANIARRHEVNGSVRNLADGTVEVIAQGERGAVMKFLSEVAGAMRGNIERSDSEELDVQDELAGFHIRH